MWLGHRTMSGFNTASRKYCGTSLFHHVACNLAGEFAPYHAGRDLAFAETRYPRLLGILLYQSFLLRVTTSAGISR